MDKDPVRLMVKNTFIDNSPSKIRMESRRCSDGDVHREAFLGSNVSNLHGWLGPEPVDPELCSPMMVPVTDTKPPRMLSHRMPEYQGTRGKANTKLDGRRLADDDFYAARAEFLASCGVGTGRIPAPAPAPVPGPRCNADAFKEASELCCPYKMEEFFNDLLGCMGLKVCSKRHVQGLMHWFSCVPTMDFQYVLDIINNGNPCKYWCSIEEDCAVLSPQCQGDWCR